MTLNGAKGNNRKKTYYIVNAVQIPIVFCFLIHKNLIFEKDNLIKN